MLCLLLMGNAQSAKDTPQNQLVNYSHLRVKYDLCKEFQKFWDLEEFLSRVSLLEEDYCEELIKATRK